MIAAAPARAGVGAPVTVRWQVFGQQQPPRPLAIQTLRCDSIALHAANLVTVWDTARQGVHQHSGGQAAAAAAAAEVAVVPGVRQRRRQRLVHVPTMTDATQPGVEEPPLLLQRPTLAPPAKLKRQQLSAAEQRELATAAASGNHHAAAILVDANCRLVHYFANRLSGQGLAREDLVAEGRRAMERAAQRYQPRPGCAARFSTFATTFILNAMSRAVHEQSRDIRLPVHHFRDMSRVRSATLGLVMQLQQQPTWQQVAERCGFGISYTLHLVRAMGSQQSSRQVLRMLDNDLSVLAEGDGAYLGGAVINVDEEAEDELAEEERRWLLEQELRSWLAKLPEQQARVVELRFGLDNRGQLRSFKEVGECLKYSGAWASAQYNLAERKLQASMGGAEQLHVPSSSLSSPSSGGGGGSASPSPAVSALEVRAQADAAGADAVDALTSALASLKPIELLVMALRFGWLDGTEATFTEAANRINRTRKGVSNLLKKAERLVQVRLQALGHRELDLRQFCFTRQQREAWQQHLDELQQLPPASRGCCRDARAPASKSSSSQGR